jgi:general secretion pathway protein J
VKTGAASGFTLVEMMVALVIFGLIAGAGVSLLSFSVRAQQAAGSKLHAILDQGRIASLLDADLALAVPRVWRDERGNRQAAFSESEGQGIVIAYVRSGWRNPGGAPRPGLQRVALRLRGDKLERVSAANLDGQEAKEVELLATGVTALKLRYRAKGLWQDRWLSTRTDALPQAVSMTLTQRGRAPVTMHFLVGVGLP